MIRMRMGKDDAFEAIQPQAESQLLRVDIRREIDQHIVAQRQRRGIESDIIVKILLEVDLLVVLIQHLDIQRQALQLFN